MAGVYPALDAQEDRSMRRKALPALQQKAAAQIRIIFMPERPQAALIGSFILSKFSGK